MPTKCPTCHAENPDTKQFCGDCGTKLDISSDAASFITKTLETAGKGLALGSTFAGRYQILEELGKGGMGAVYKALDTQINEDVAIKLIRPDIASDEKTLERFSNELKLARKIAHKNICKMYHLEKGEETPYISMEYLDGEDLKKIIRDKEKLSAKEAVGIAQQVCEGLLEAHRLGVVHRDLKPQNIMIDKRGQTKIMDFGIARSVEAPGVTATGVIIGTPDYISPEQADGKEADERADIYSLGVILYEMVTGSVPFRGDTALSVAIKHKTQLPSDPRKLNPEVSDDLARLILICMEKDRERRYQTAGELLADLTNIKEGFPLGTKIRPRRQTFVSALIRKKLFIPALVFALIIIALAIWKLLPQKAPTPFSSGVPSLAVLPFENISNDESLDVSRDALVSLMFFDLFPSQLIHVLSDDQINGILQDLDLLDTDKFNSNDLARIAKEGRVDYVVRGSIIPEGEKIRLNLIVQKPAEKKILKTSTFQFQNGDELTARVNEMTLQIKEALQFTQQQISFDLDREVRNVTSSLEALKFYREGIKHYVTDQDWRKSIECMEKAIESDPNFAMAYRSMGVSYGHLGYSREAHEAFAKALELSDHVSERERLLIQGYALSTRIERRKAYEKILESYPYDFIANNQLGVIYMNREEYDKSLEYLEANYRNGGIFPMTVHGLAIAYMFASRYDEAEKLCKKHYEMLSKNNDAVIILIYADQGKYGRALKEAKKMGIPPPLMLLLLTGDFDGAEEKYREWLKSDEPSDQRNGRMSLSRLYSAQGKFKAAEEELHKALDLGKQNNQKLWILFALRDLMYLKLSLGKAEEALTEWEKFQDIWTGGQITWELYYRAQILIRLQDFEAADKAARIFKENLDVYIEEYQTHKYIRYWHFLQGLKALEEGKLSDSVSHLKEAVSLIAARDVSALLEDWEHALFREPLARAYYELGDQKKAREEYEKITQLTSGRVGRGDIYARSFYMLGKIHEQLGKKSKAKKNYQKFLDLWNDSDPGIVEVEDARKRLAGL